MNYYESLKLELTNDPTGIGYSGMNTQQIVDALNDKNISIPRQTMTADQLMNNVVKAEYSQLTDGKKLQLLTLLTASYELNPYGFAADVLVDLFTAGSQTIQNLAQARVKLISRAEQLWGVGVIIKPQWVKTAQAL